MSIPANMQAIEIQSERLVTATRPVPAVKSGSALIKVLATGVNQSDILQRKGKYPPPPGASDIPGLEIAGTVVALGDNCDNLTIGDKVCALVTGGGYAEYCLASASLCLPIPENLSFSEAAGIPETYFTVWSNVFGLGRLQQGESLLVQGGSSGVGTTAIQLAKAFGNKIFVTAGSTEKCQFCLDLGADAAINYHQQDFVSEIAQLTDYKGVNVILDMIGGDYLPRNLQCLAVEGRLVQIGVQKSPKTEMNLLPIILKRLTVTGSTLRSRDDTFKAKIAKQIFTNVWPLFESGKIRPVIDSTFALTNASEAHELMESSQHMGKIILTVTT